MDSFTSARAISEAIKVMSTDSAKNMTANCRRLEPFTLRTPISFTRNTDRAVDRFI